MLRENDLFSVKGKRALVTGAPGYLGAQMAFALAEAGAHVFVNSRSEPKCRAMTEKLQANGFSAESACFDVTDKNAIKNFANSLADSPLHIIVNNAYSGKSGSIETTSDDASYADSYNSAVIAAHNLVRYLLPNLRSAVQQDRDASVVNIGSMYGVVSPDLGIYETHAVANPPFYGAAKAALIQWTKYAACEFGVEGIRVNAISPGAFPSEETQLTQPEFVSRLADKPPLKRVGQADELRGPLLFLASQASSYVTGGNLVVDGGWVTQ